MFLIHGGGGYLDIEQDMEGRSEPESVLAGRRRLREIPAGSNHPERKTLRDKDLS